MKTLDEVIKAFSKANKEVGCGDCKFNDAESDDIPCEMNDCFFNDALFYLKEYQKVDSNYWSEKAISELNNIADAYFLRAYREDKDELTALLAYRKEQNENAPLTWSELKQMEGKPVWVEYISCNRKAWAIVDCFYTDAFLKDRMNVALPHDYWNLEKEMMGKTWQAYRKERK